MTFQSEDAGTPRTNHFEDISEGTKASFDYVISNDVFDSFLKAFRDVSPIHVDADYAISCGFEGRVMHGSLLNGFLSHFVGVHFPGKLSLLLSSDLRFAQPSYLGDAIRIEAVVAQKMESGRVVVLNMTFTNQTRNCLAARGRVQVMVRKSLP